MKKTCGVMAVITMVALAMSVSAGEKCSGNTQDCLNKMVKNLQNRGWVGIEIDDEGGVGNLVVTDVVEGSPAEMAGFKPGDVLVAVNGVKFSEENQTELKETQYAMVPGADFTYTVARGGSQMDLDVELGHIPDNVMAQWVGGHMIEHAEVQMASAK